MRSFGELVEKFCPTGVEMKNLDEIGLFIRGRGFAKADLTDVGRPAIHYGQIYTDFRISTRTSRSCIKEQTANSSQVAIPGDLLIAISDVTPRNVGRAVAWLGDTEVAIGGDILAFRHKLNPMYVAYFFDSRDFNLQKAPLITGATIRHLSAKTLGRIRIPIPPVEVQEQIVRILDAFTALEMELGAELEARKVQLTALLDHFYPPFEPNATEALALGDCGDFIRGNGMLKSTLVSDGTPAIHYGEIHTHYRASTRTTRSFVSSEYGAKLRKAQPGDVVLATTAEDNLGVAKACAWLGSVPAAVSGDAYIFTSNLDPLFAAYFFQSRNFALQKATQITGTKVKRISGAALSKVLIPRLGIREQAHIGELLQKVDSLAHDDSSGIGAEMAARHKQYEYYRDQLLAFKEA